MTLEETASKLFVKKRKKTLTSKLSSMLMATFICHFTHFQYRQHEEANKYNTHKPHSHTQSPLHHCEFAIQLTHTLYSTPSWRNRRLRPQLQRSTWFWQDNHLPSLWNPPAKWTYSIPRYDCSSQTGTGLHFPNETCQEYIVIINNLDFVQRAKILRSENLFLSGACQFLGLWCTK